MKGLVKHRSRVEGLILFLREERVLLDADLATIYGVSTKALNQAVKRNGERFPIDFRFQLSDVEKQEVVTKCDHLVRLKYSKARPYAFTEHGALMVANVRWDCSRKAPTRVGVKSLRTRRGGLQLWPYCAPNPLRGGAPKGARNGRIGGPPPLRTSRIRAELWRVTVLI